MHNTSLSFHEEEDSVECTTPGSVVKIKKLWSTVYQQEVL